MAVRVYIPFFKDHTWLMSKDKKYWLPGFNPRRTNSSILSLNVITDKVKISDDKRFNQLWEKNFTRFCFEKL